MEHRRIVSLLNESSDSKVVSRISKIVIDQSSSNYDVETEVIYNTEVSKSNLCDYNDAYILVRGNITIVGDNRTHIALKNCAPFFKCITQIDGTTIDDAEDLDLVMSMYDLLKYSSNYFDTTGSLWFYSKDEATSFNSDIGNNATFKSFMYKSKLLEDAVAQPTPDYDNGFLKKCSSCCTIKISK